MSARGASSFVVVGICLAVGAGALWASTRYWPGAADEREIVDFLRKTAEPGDLVVVTPSLSLDRLRPYVRAGLTAVSADDDRVLVKSGFSRAWIVGPLGAVRKGHTAPRAPSPGATILRTERAGATVISLVARREEAPRSVGAMRELLAGASATVRAAAPGSPERPCGREHDKLRCGTEGWQWLGTETITVKGARRVCIWAHPIAGHVITMMLPALAAPGPIRVTTLLSDAAIARTHGAPVDVVVTKGGHTLARWSHGFKDSVVDRDLVLPPDTAAAPLHIEIGALQDGVAHFCIDARRRP